MTPDISPGSRSFRRLSRLARLAPRQARPGVGALTRRRSPRLLDIGTSVRQAPRERKSDRASTLRV